MHPVIANSTDTRYNDDVVPPKSKRRKLEKDAYDELNCVDTFISPIKATQTNTINEHVHIMHKGRSTAILGRPYYEGLPHLSGSVHENNVVLWRILLDSGSDGDLLFVHSHGQKTSVPYFVREATQTWHTSMGIFRTEKQGDLDVVFPEFSNSKRIHIEPDIIDIADDAPEPMFDLIIGTETMQKLDCILDFKNKVIEIDHIQLPMRKLSALNNPNKRLEIYYNSFYVEPDVTKEATERTVRILDAKYEKADLPEVIHQNCKHLTRTEREKLIQLLTDFEELFDGTLGDWKTSPVSLKLKEGIRPYHGKAYPVPHIHKDTLKKEVDRLVEIGVLKRIEDSEYASPCFIIPKKNKTVRFLTDFREVNKRLVRHPWPIPKIQTILQELEGFRWATSLDLNMGYYTIRLDPDSQKICTVILPWGKYAYLRLPMGIAGSPDIFQEKMSNLMANLEFVRVYLDDILTITKSTFDDHLEKLRLVLVKLKDANLRVNVAKSLFCSTEVEYLGYILTRDGIKPQSNKVAAILALLPPTSVRTLRRFLGLVQYYRDLWEKRSDILAPLTDLVGECGVTKSKKSKAKPWHWDDVHQDAFEAAKATIARHVVLAYPNFDQVFEIYTDASSRQLGAVISQENRPIAFFSRKLTKAQEKYSITELELLSIVETLKEFRGMLWGMKIKIYTDHMNLMRDALGLTSNRVYRWRLILEEFAPEIVYIKGIHNTVADAISRLDYDPSVNPDRMTHAQTRVEENGGHVNVTPSPRTHNSNFSQMKTILNNLTGCESSCPTLGEDTSTACASLQTEINRCFANSSEEEEVYPLTVSEIRDAQLSDKHLRKIFKRGGETKENSDHTYIVSIIEDTKVITDKSLRMVIPKPLQSRAVIWYHYYLQHPGHTRLEETLKATMTWHGMRPMIREYTKRCKACQFNKIKRNNYGKLPTKTVVTNPWETLCVDLIGPYTLKGLDGKIIDFMCLTMIDPATSWFEMVELPVIEVINAEGKSAEIFEKTSARIATLANQQWFCRYPRCRNIIYDNGSEFKLYFQDLCTTFGLKRKPTTIKNPTANAILERVHQVISSMLRTSEIDMSDTISEDDVATFICDAAYAIRSTHHTVLKCSPGAAIFGRDMLFDIPFIADWDKIGKYRQEQTNRNTERENKRRRDYDYVVGGKILIRKDGILRKGESRWQGPYTITQCHTNGTIRVQRGSKSERLNIRRVTPFFE